MAGSALAADDAEQATHAVLDRVEVTGSRIKRTQLEGAMPVTIVTREDIERTGVQSLGDILQELPAAGAAINTNVNNGGDGSTKIDLRNLGPNRVLVLVNGRRWVNNIGGEGGVDGAIDLNSIPLSIVERVEVLKDGASAAYGSDAIAGVVNIITRKDFEGAEANAFLGEFEQGDGHLESYDFSLGSAGTRASAFINASYFKAQPVWAGDRNISKEPLFRTANAFGSSTTPMGRFRIPDAGGTLGAAYSIFGGAGATRETGGDPTPTVGDFRSFVSANDSYNFAPENYMATPSERWAIYAQGRYDITDNVTFTTEALFNKRISEQLLASMPVVVGTLGQLADDAPFGVHATNPYNFFGLTLSPTAPAANTTDGVLRANSLQRRFIETGGRSFNQDVATYRLGAGFEGVFEAFGARWDWNLGHVFARNTDVDVTNGLLNTARLRTALGPLSSCTSPCVPLNLFGGVGSITNDMLDYVSFNAHSDFGYSLRDTTLVLSGEPFDLHAGPLGLAIGFERRKEEGFDDPDALIDAGNTTGNQRSPTSGAFSLDEAFIEFSIPIVREVALAQSLDLEVAARWSDYDTFGRTTNGKLGLRWQPIGDLLVRATYQDGFRAPNIGEQFTGGGDVFPTLTDPCSVAPTSGGTGPAGGLDPTPDTQTEADLFANCTGFTGAIGNGTTSFSVSPLPGIPASAWVPLGAAIGGNPLNGFAPASMYSQSNAQIRVTFGTFPGLGPETSESMTVGLVYSPGYIDGLSITLDWYRIELDQAIGTVRASMFLDGCYASGDPQLCSTIQRFDTGDIDDVFQGVYNFSSFDVAGLDLNVVYRVGGIASVPGEWKLTWDTAFLDEWSRCTPNTATPAPDDENCVDEVQFNDGDSSNPAFKSLLDIDWSWGDWEATWRIRFIGRQYEACTAPTLTTVAASKFWGGSPPNGWHYCSNPSASTNRLGATTYHSVQVSYVLDQVDTRLTFGIQNIGDKRPPVSTQAFANSFDPTTYEVPGRFPYLRVSKTF